MIARFYPVFVVVLVLLSAGACAAEDYAPPPSVACTMEAKLCPDGSGVSRTGPHCEFAACPSATNNNKGSIEGRIVKGPLSPVERMGESNQTGATGEIVVTNAAGEEMAMITSDSDGSFQIDLPPGQYTLQVRSDVPVMVAKPQTVSVESGQVTKTELMLDTGIR